MRAARNRRMLLFSLLFLFAVEPALARQGRDTTLSPYFYVAGRGGATEAFPLKSTRVVANVDGVIAEVTVTQLYANEGTQPINARYVFPASTRASVHGLR